MGGKGVNDRLRPIQGTVGVISGAGVFVGARRMGLVAVDVGVAVEVGDGVGGCGDGDGLTGGVSVPMIAFPG